MKKLARRTMVAVVFMLAAAVAARHLARRGDAATPKVTCYLTGGGQLRVCHAAAAEGVFYKPGPLQLAYNTQIIALGGGRYATVLHSEAKDLADFYARTGGLRPGDSIKGGVVDAGADARAVYRAPEDLGYRIWGSLNNPASPLFYAFDKAQPGAIGLSGGGNPMVVRGRADDGDPYYYMFYLAVTSDEGQERDWRNVLLEARTRDFVKFDVLQKDGWSAFNGDAATPAIVADVDGNKIESNQAAQVQRVAAGPGRPVGAVPTEGVFGSIVRVNGVYDYFYTNQDPTDPTRDHLYVRTAGDLNGDRRWSAPRIVMDVPAQIMFRVAKARGMNRWAIFYTCLRSVRPAVFDVCLQYTENLQLSGPGSLGGLQLFDGPVFDGLSHYALGLIGGDTDYGDGGFIKAQHYYLTDADGNLAAPPDAAGAAPEIGGLLTWNDLPRNRHIFGSPTYWALWDVTPVGLAQAAP